MTIVQSVVVAAVVTLPVVAVAQQMDHQMPMPGMEDQSQPETGPRKKSSREEPAVQDTDAMEEEDGTPAGHNMDTMQRQGMDAMPDHDMRAMSTGPQEIDTPAPPEALSGAAHAADQVYGQEAMAEAREDLKREQGDFRAYMIMADQLEQRFRDDLDGYLWDAQGWYGGDYNKLWIKTDELLPVSWTPR